MVAPARDAAKTERNQPAMNLGFTSDVEHHTSVQLYRYSLTGIDDGFTKNFIPIPANYFAALPGPLGIIAINERNNRWPLTAMALPKFGTTSIREQNWDDHPSILQLCRVGRPFKST